MPKSCIFKVIMGGAPGSGKTSFLRGTFFPSFNNDDEINQIGVSFKLIDCLVNNEDSYLLQIWDLKTSPIFKHLYPSFCSGAKGSLLCFDITNRNSFTELRYWIEIVRRIAGKIPIFLIATKTDLNKYSVTEEEIQDLIEEYRLDGFFFTSINDEKHNEIFKQLIKKMKNLLSISSFSMLLPLYDYKFDNFMKFFSVCPICERRNHVNYLKKFYFSKDHEYFKLKENLLKLLEKSNDIGDLYYNKVKIGIPCCRCYDNLFRSNIN